MDHLEIIRLLVEVVPIPKSNDAIYEGIVNNINQTPYFSTPQKCKNIGIENIENTNVSNWPYAFEIMLFFNLVNFINPLFILIYSFSHNESLLEPKYSLFAESIN